MRSPVPLLLLLARQVAAVSLRDKLTPYPEEQRLTLYVLAAYTGVLIVSWVVHCDATLRLTPLIWGHFYQIVELFYDVSRRVYKLHHQTALDDGCGLHEVDLW